MTRSCHPLVDFTAAHNADFEPVDVLAFGALDPREPMRRRKFMTLLGGAAAWPLAAKAQQGGKPATIGSLGSGTLAAQSQWTAAFVQRLRELGWTDGRNVAIEYRWAEGRTQRFAEIADEFVRLKVDVIVTHNTPPILAAKQATSVSRSCSRRQAIRLAPAS